ncbi:MAG: BrxA family protein [Chloroflexota bacterium]|nr:BrxA family protein [Chloroflexota bacterium]
MNTSLAQREKRPYTVTGLTKGTPSLDEIQTLLLHWRPSESPNDFADRVQQEGILTKQTARRVRDLVLALFRPWFLKPDDRAARRLKAFVEAGGDRRVLNELVFLYKARSEAVLYDFTLERFWPACYDGALYLRTPDIEDFLQEAQEVGRTTKRLSPQTQAVLARGISRSLTTVGFLSAERRYAREYVIYRPTDSTIAYLAYDLHLAGLTDSTLVEHPDWGLFGLTREHTLDRLDALDERAGMIVQRAGSVVSITWLHATMDEVIDAYTR